MSIEKLHIGEPFFTIEYITDEKEVNVVKPSILLNISQRPIVIQSQKLPPLESFIVVNSQIKQVDQAILVVDYGKNPDENLLFEKIKKTWDLAYNIRKEERLKGVSHYLSPKVSFGNITFSLYHSGSVPLNVGLHKIHYNGKNIKEVHTQITGIGKMQQCLEKNVNTLYLEEIMAPGMTHKPMYDDHGNYPWHQYETITPSVFMATEILVEEG